ncbi:hypothetical protein [Bordetella genomosp. 9]|uniref:ESPR domain-containing protein n=1 Tax=Bordetella genomosp. 9 TaxID=1416803 RepID=A0A1W6YW11_9BORD|nr:hypothetical protein [Bordetella genomosp. 9]ARP85089.1 hypothetical protein CAL13_01800 [Bordetella genomosp. 9]
MKLRRIAAAIRVLCRPQSLTPVLCLLSIARPEAALATCDIFNPATGQTVTCGTGAPNPATTPLAAAPASTDVTVNVLPSAGIAVGDTTAVAVNAQSRVTNQGSISSTGAASIGVSLGADSTLTNAAGDLLPAISTLTM